MRDGHRVPSDAHVRCIILLREPVIAAGDRLAIEKQFTAAVISV
jgi:hypothetical protein